MAVAAPGQQKPGRVPFVGLPQRRLLEKLEQIGEDSYGSVALKKIRMDNKREGRISTKDALDAEYFCTDPLPCDPKSLPTYEASQEFQTKGKRQQQRQAEEAVKRKKLQRPPPHSRLPPIQHPGPPHQIRPGQYGSWQ